MLRGNLAFFTCTPQIYALSLNVRTVDRIHVLLFLVLSSTHDECISHLMSYLTLFEHIDSRLIVVAVIRRGSSVLVLASFQSLNVSDATLITVIV